MSVPHGADWIGRVRETPPLDADRPRSDGPVRELEQQMADAAAGAAITIVFSGTASRWRRPSGEVERHRYEVLGRKVD